MWDGIIGWIILLFNNFSLNGFSVYVDPCLNHISHKGLQNGDFFGRQLCSPLYDQRCTKWWFFKKILLLLHLFSSILLKGRIPFSIIFSFSSLIFVCTKYYVCMCYHYLLYVFLIMSLNSCFRLIDLLFLMQKYSISFFFLEILYFFLNFFKIFYFF